MRSILYFRQQGVGYRLYMLWLALVLYACGGASQNQPTYAPLPIKVIIVLNGLWQNTDIFNDTIESLSTAFKKGKIEVRIHRVVEMQSSERPITDQANYAFSEIKQYYTGQDYEIILIGNSQGGLRGVKILDLNKKDGNPLNIKGLITLDSPLEGAHAAILTPAYVDSLLQKKSTQVLLKLGNLFSDASVEDLIRDAREQLFNPQHYPTYQPGVRDINPNSSFLREIKSIMEHNQLPILAIAGWYKGSVAELLPTEKDSADNHINFIRKFPSAAVDKIYANAFAGSSQHDMVVPLDSQLAKHITSKCIERHTIVGAIHDELPGFIVPRHQIIYNHPETTKLIVEFAKKNFRIRPLPQTHR